jgi:hypothetical protein
MAAKDIDSLLITTVLTLASDLAGVIAAIAAILLVRRIYGFQLAHTPP